MGAYACLGQGDGQGRADAVIDDAAQIVYAEDIGREGSAVGVGMVTGPGRSGSVRIAKTENLKSFEHGREGDLESGGRIKGAESGRRGVGVLHGRLGVRRGIISVGREEGLVEKGGG